LPESTRILAIALLLATMCLACTNTSPFLGEKDVRNRTFTLPVGASMWLNFAEGEGYAWDLENLPNPRVASLLPLLESACASANER
jgi:hypothetical protein